MTASQNCPWTEHCQALLDDVLPPNQRPGYEQHLESCPACQARLDRAEDSEEGLRQLGRQVGDPTSGPVDATLAEVLERLHEVKSRGPAARAEAPDLYFLQPPDRPDLLGILGPYEVQEVIGQGGMGVVLKAFEPALHRLVAIKVLAAAVAGSATARKRFTREAQAAAAVCHDHVVAVHGVNEEGGLPYLVMQYVAGESLQERLDRSGPLEVVEIVRIGLQTASGLAAAHAQGLIHRDIKPANLLLENGLAKVKITDFGLARMTDDVGLTQNGVVAGTPEYMAPEQARGEPVDHRADLFSLGSVLYAICTGVPPFRGSNALAVLLQVGNKTPTPIRALNPEVPAWLEALVNRLLAKVPADRFQSAAEVAELLEGYLAHLREPATAPAPALPPGRCREPSGTRRGPGSARRAYSCREPSGTPTAAPSGRAWEPGPAQAPRRGRWGLRAAVLVLTALGLAGAVLLLNGLLPDQPLPLTFHQDFRGGRRPEPPLVLIGSDANDVTRPEDGGFRITLPAQRKEKGPVGLELTSPIDGDFEITAGYELLQVDRPRGDFGVGFELWLQTATAAKEALGCYRLLRVPDGDVFACTRMTTVDGKRQRQQKYAPAGSTAGQLRLMRQGNKVTCWAAEGTAGAFRELHSFDLGPEDLKTVRLAALAGNGVAVDLRIVDLQIRSNGPFAGLLQEPTQPSTAPRKAGGKRWLVAGGIVAAVIAGTCLVGIWLVFRQRRGTGGSPACERKSRRAACTTAAPASDKQPAPEKAARSVFLSCSGCGKTLKGKPQLAGKKVKCPKCGKAIVVAAAAP